MYKIRLILLFVLPMFCQAQIDRTRTWVFGDGVGLRFTPKGLIADTSYYHETDNFYKTYEGTSVWNYENGNIKYYVIAGFLLDSSNQKLNDRETNWAGGGSSASQGAIITSVNDSLYYVFGTTSGAPIFYNIWNGVLGIWVKKRTVLRKSASEAQSLVNHQDGRNQWVVCHSRLGDTLFAYLITDKGLETCPVISHAGPFYDDWYPGQGVIKFSPDGKYIVFTTWNLDNLIFCSFNNQTGEIHESFRIASTGANGAEFSENYLFLSCSRDGKIRRFSLDNLHPDSVLKSNTIIYDTSDLFSIGQIQKAPDGNIYVALDGANRLGMILPGKYGHAFKYTKPLFGTKKCYLGFPNFNASYFHTPAVNFSYSRNCQTNTFRFIATDTTSASAWYWLYSKGTKSYTGSGKQCSFQFPDTGTWQVRCIATAGTRADTVLKTIEILKPLPAGFLGEDLLLPAGTGIAGTIAGPAGMHCTHWYRPGDTTEKKQTDFSYTDTGLYICQATNKVFCMFEDTIRVLVCDSFARSSAIYRKGDSLFTATWAARYQWFLGNNAISGASGPQLKLYSPGVYKLRTWNKAGCDSMSADFTVIVLDVSLPIARQTFSIVPNPNNGRFQIMEHENGIVDIEIFDAIGALIWCAKGLNHVTDYIPNAALTPGVYTVRVNGSLVQRLLVCQ